MLTPLTDSDGEHWVCKVRLSQDTSMAPLMANSSLMFAAPHLPCSHHLSVRQGWDLISLALVPFAFYPFLVSTSNFAVPDSCITETQQRAR